MKKRFLTFSCNYEDALNLLNRLQDEGYEILSAGSALVVMAKGFANAFSVVASVPIDAPETKMELELKELANRKIVAPGGNQIPFRKGK